MITSVGIFLVRPTDRYILIGHPTHSADGTGFWSIPKGKMDTDDTSPVETMKRELREETSFDLSNYAGVLVRLGEEVYKHKKKKILAYVYFLRDEIKESPVCTSLVSDKRGRLFPEMDVFEWVSFDKAVDQLHYAQSALLVKNKQLIQEGYKNDK